MRTSCVYLTLCTRVTASGKPSSSSIIRSHQLVVLHPARKLLLPQRRRMRPRLQPVLLPDRSRETARPLLPRVMPHHVLNRPLVHQLRIAAHVVFQYCQPRSRPALYLFMFPSNGSIA